jgi:5'-methylthioinosine phosphorylase
VRLTLPLYTSNNIDIAVIGGSGFYEFSDLRDVEVVSVGTPYGEVTGLTLGLLDSHRLAFIARHGVGHKSPPHLINYRANIWALKSLGVQRILAVNAVGGIAASMGPRTFVIPHQLIDYTYARAHTFAEVLTEEINHVDFTEPFSANVRQALIAAFAKVGTPCVDGGVIGCTQGPRLETAAEVLRLKRDGCDLVGMTTMPEAALARELGMDYAALCTVVNFAAGLSQEPISLADIHSILAESAPILRAVLAATIRSL